MSRIQYRLRAFRKRRGDFKKRRGEEGFTLIELMVVVLIMGVLAAIAIPTFLGAKKGAQNASVTSNLRNLLTDQATAYANNGSYADAAALEKIDPTYTADLTAAATAPGAITVVAGTTTPSYVCMYETSASGAWFGIGSVASGSAAGTYYTTGTGTMPTTCTGTFPTGTAAGDWSTTAKAAGF